MPILESLVVGLGSAVATGILKMWLKDDLILQSTSIGVVEILKAKTSNIMQRGAAEREFQKIRDRSAQSFQQLIDKEQTQLTESQIETIANAAAEVVSRTPLTPELLVQNNLNPEDLCQHFLSRPGSEGGNPGLASNPLFQHFLLHASQQIVNISSQLPHFTERVFSELLQRDNRLFEIANLVLQGFDQLVAAQKGIDPDAERFETQYRMACVRKFDQLELFGVDLQESNRRYKLSVAYVTLEVERTVISEIEDQEDAGEECLSEPLPVNEALSRAPRLLIRGLAGSGKTTLVQWITVFCAAKDHVAELSSFNDLIPFVITLRDFDDGKLPSPDQFANKTAPFVAGEPRNWSIRALESGRAIVLIDGLDEAAEEHRSTVRNWLRDLLAQYPQARYVVTTRPHAVEEGWLDKDDFLDATLQDMNSQDISRFVSHWHSSVASGIDDEETRQKLPALQDALLSELKKNTDLAKLATSPLLCAMICALHRDRNRTLPSDRVSLYRACIEMFFRRDTERRVSMSDYVALDDTQKLLLLRSLAYWLIRNRKSSATSEETHQKFDHALAELNNRPPGAAGQSVAKLFIQRVGSCGSFPWARSTFPPHVSGVPRSIGGNCGGGLSDGCGSCRKGTVAGSRHPDGGAD